jgi:formylglycine-generating enzyme required for sulfatase activity/serine/threonine protein kinase
MATFEPGFVIGREFRIVRPLRAGGMGEVYIAEQLSTGKLRALKVLSAQFVNDPSARERFIREARVGSNIDSDHIVEVVTAGVDEASGCAFLVMELLRGEDLDEIVERLGRISLADAVEIFSQVGHALERAHAIGVVHRDIKPANVFLAAPRRRGAPFTAKLLDFGIAKAVEDTRLTGSQALGTPLYMAPEQMARAATATPAADVWALGLVAFRLLTGFDFWRAADDSLPALMKEICVEAIPAASERARELTAAGRLPPGFDAWFSRCVAREPKDRFPEAGAAARAFAELLPAGTPPGTIAEWLMENVPASIDAASLSASGTGTPGPRAAVGTDPTLHASGPSPVAASIASARAESPGETGAARPTTSAAGAARGGARHLFIAAGVLVVSGAGFFVLRASRAPEPPAPASLPTSMAPAPLVASAAPAPTCPDGMVEIHGGTMFMGDLALDNAKPPHKVTLSSYCLDKLEVTAAAYDACAKAGNCLRAPTDVHFPDMTEAQHAAFSEFCTSGRVELANHPINCVDWHMADNFCRTRGGRLPGGGARLPTEAEWEYAARGSGQRTYPWGDTPPDHTRLNGCGPECATWFEKHKMPARAMYDASDGYAGTAPVGSFPEGASEAGILDLAGNVWEWTADWYEEYTRDERENPKGPPTGTERVVRGGSFNGTMTAWARPAYRWETAPDVYNHAIGFRCAKDL